MKEETSADLSRFLAMLEAQRRVSVHTLAAYRRDVQRFLAFCADQAELRDWCDISPHHVRAHIARRHQEKITARSLQRELSAIRGFFAFLLKEGRLGQNPARGVRAPKAPRHLPAVLDVDQMIGLLEAGSEGDLEQRDRAMWELFYSSGLRLRELTALDCADLDLAAGSVLVRAGKGDKSRLVPVGSKACAALRDWLAIRSLFAPPQEGALFVSQRGRRIAPRTVQMRLRRWGYKYGSDRRLHPHLLRHSFASHMLEGSGDLRAVQELLGHAHIATTQIYTHVDFQRLATVYDQTHPRARRHPAAAASEDPGTGEV